MGREQQQERQLQYGHNISEKQYPAILAQKIFTFLLRFQQKYEKGKKNWEKNYFQRFFYSCFLFCCSSGHFPNFSLFHVFLLPFLPIFTMLVLLIKPFFI